MSETSETTTRGGARFAAVSGAEGAAAAAGGAAETVATVPGRVEERATPWLRLRMSPTAASDRALVIASLGTQPPEGDSFFAADNSMGGTRIAFFSGFGAAMFFSRNGSRSRSAITSRTMSRSIVLRWRAHASDMALKHRLLILRGMP